MDKDKFIEVVQKIVSTQLQKLGFFINEWHLGKVAVIHPGNFLDIYIDGSSYATPNIPGNPDITFQVGDYVWVHFVNRKPNNLFVPYKRNVTI